MIAPCNKSGRGWSGDDEDDYDGGRRVAQCFFFLRAISICATVANSPPHSSHCQLCALAHLFEIDLLVIADSWIKVSKG